MTPVAIFQSHLIERRKMKGMTQAVLAEKIGISKRAMCYYEKGSKSFPSSKILLQLANALDCQPEELLAPPEITTMDGRSLEARVVKKFSAIAQLPESDRKILIQLLDSLLEKNELLSKIK